MFNALEQLLEEVKRARYREAENKELHEIIEQMANYGVPISGRPVYIHPFDAAGIIDSATTTVIDTATQTFVCNNVTYKRTPNIPARSKNIK